MQQNFWVWDDLIVIQKFNELEKVETCTNSTRSRKKIYNKINKEKFQWKQSPEIQNGLPNQNAI